MENSNVVYELNDYYISFYSLQRISSLNYFQFQFPFKSALIEISDCLCVQKFIYIYIYI